MEVTAIYGLFFVHRRVLCAPCLKYGRLDTIFWWKAISHIIFEGRKKIRSDLCLSKCIANLPIKPIKYAYSWCQAELFICISCEISDFAKSRESLKITSEKEISYSAVLYVLASTTKELRLLILFYYLRL